jgi:hypothetical protein
VESKITVSTGVVFKIKKAPSLVFQSLASEFKRNEPKIPVLENVGKGRKEENPNDPDYLKAKEEYDNKTNLALLDAALVVCTELDTLPADMELPDGPNWVENLLAAGMNLDLSTKRKRYLAWVKFFAAPMDEDILAFNKEIARLNGVSEGDVTAAMAASKST